jgi:hypothetical protein
LDIVFDDSQIRQSRVWKNDWLAGWLNWFSFNQLVYLYNDEFGWHKENSIGK